MQSHAILTIRLKTRVTPVRRLFRQVNNSEGEFFPESNRLRNVQRLASNHYVIKSPSFTSSPAILGYV